MFPLHLQHLLCCKPEREREREKNKPDVLRKDHTRNIKGETTVSESDKNIESLARTMIYAGGGRERESNRQRVGQMLFESTAFVHPSFALIF